MQVNVFQFESQQILFLPAVIIKSSIEILCRSTMEQGINANYLEKWDINSLNLIKIYFLINSSNSEKWYALSMSIKK